jgi:hypothetical protein
VTTRRAVLGDVRQGDQVPDQQFLDDWSVQNLAEPSPCRFLEHAPGSMVSSTARLHPDPRTGSTGNGKRMANPNQRQLGNFASQLETAGQN